ncbi:thiamine-binding protein [Streptomyces sp. NPDC088400]|uniref:thiamine-binding protein n=1 Tax=Streptomyces sp. NPDC088400 TaxID=3365861 RepID=UPI0037F8FB8D
MRLRVEFTTEPFDLDEAPAHAVVAREVVQRAELDTVDVGPFGNTVEGRADAVLASVDTLLRESLAAGATRVSLQVNVIADAGPDAATDSPTPADASPDAADGEGGR